MDRSANRKIVIFISSTSEDLTQERKVVRTSLQQFNVEIRGMEDFGAQPEPSLDVSLQEVSGSDVYIGIIGMRYGIIDKKTGKSYTQLEYEKARENELSCLIYLIHEEEAKIPPKNVDCQNAKELQEFKNMLGKGHTYYNYRSLEDLSARVTLDISKLFAKKGWGIDEPRFVTASANSGTVAQGDILIIGGTATGKPAIGVSIWIFGNEYFTQSYVSVETGGYYEYIIPSELSRKMIEGQYFIVIQHPMANDRFDVFTVSSGLSTFVRNIRNSNSFTVAGPNSIKGADAAVALVNMLNEKGIDDTYTKLSFMIEKPWIRIDDIGQKYVGDTFKITGTTNLLEGNGLFIQIIPSSSIHFEMMIDPFSFISGFITVQRGEMYNTFSFDVDASTFKPDQYRIIIKSSKVEIIADKNFTVCTS